MKRDRPQLMIALAVLLAACTADAIVGTDEGVPDRSGGLAATEAPGDAAQPRVTPAPTSAPGQEASRNATTTAAEVASTAGASSGGEGTDPPGEKLVDQLEPDPVIGEVPADLLNTVLADASERSGSEALVVTRAEFVEWPDGSLGCPEPGVMYTMAITPGYWIEIQSDETVLDYRMTEAGYFTLCESPGPVPPPTGGDS